MTAACQLIVRGRVQGVGFRYHAQRQASRFGLKGYVRNLRDGSVEMVCEGEEEDLEKFRLWASQGPPGALVSELKHRTIPFRGTFPRFSVEY